MTARGSKESIVNVLLLSSYIIFLKEECNQTKLKSECGATQTAELGDQAQNCDRCIFTERVAVCAGQDDFCLGFFVH